MYICLIKSNHLKKNNVLTEAKIKKFSLNLWMFGGKKYTAVDTTRFFGPVDVSK